MRFLSNKSVGLIKDSSSVAVLVKSLTKLLTKAFLQPTLVCLVLIPERLCSVMQQEIFSSLIHLQKYKSISVFASSLALPQITYFCFVSFAVDQIERRHHSVQDEDLRNLSNMRSLCKGVLCIKLRSRKL